MDVDDLGRASDWSGVRVVVAGFGVSGFAAADNLLFLGAQVTALDESTSDEKAEKAQLLETLGATVRLEPGATAVLPDDVDLVVTSPGWKPTAPLLAQAAERGIPVWGEVELAWRLRDPDAPAPWLAVTGTNGKTTTVQMLQSILHAAGLRAVAVGNVGLPIVEAVMDPEPYDVLAVELSSFQLHYTRSMAAESAVVLNVAEDHLDWYDDEPGAGTDPGARTGMEVYAADKARDLRAACSGPASTTSPTPPPRTWSARPTSVEGARAVGLHPRHAVRGQPRCRRGPPRRPGLHRGAGDQRRRALHARRPRLARPRTSSPTPWPRPRSPAPTASASRRCATGCAPSAPTATGSPTSRRPTA